MVYFIMSLKDAIKKLESAGFHVAKTGGNFRIWRCGSQVIEDGLDGRGVIGFAKTQTWWKKPLKHFSKRMNRAATRDALKTGKFDRIPRTGETKEKNLRFFLDF